MLRLLGFSIANLDCPPTTANNEKFITTPDGEVIGG